MKEIALEALANDAVGWLQQLLRVDTSNPPGRTVEAVKLVEQILSSRGITAKILALDPNKPNLYAQLGSANSEPGILVASHIDVVPVQNHAAWKHPPFSGAAAEGMIWGRGAIDMKYKTALDLALMVWAKEQNLKRRLELVVVSDEEVDASAGSGYLCSAQRGMLEARHVINEVGGFNVEILGRSVIVIQVGEKSHSTVRLTVTGRAEHASTALPGSTLGLLAGAISALDQAWIGFKVCQAARRFFSGLAAALPAPAGDLFAAMLLPESSQAAFSAVPDPALRGQLSGMIRTTLCPTRIGGGQNVNVVPESGWVELDCRSLPGVSEQELREQITGALRTALNSEADRCTVEILNFTPGYEIDGDDPLVAQLSTKLATRWADKLKQPIVLPMLMPAASDNSNYARAGMIPIGFAPVIFPPGFPGISLSHAVDERIPEEGFRAGVRAYIEILGGYLVGAA